MYYRCFETKFGTAALLSEGRGITAFYLPDKREIMMKRVRRDFPGATLRADADIRRAEALLKRYFTGQKVSFKNVRIDLRTLNDFTKAVLKKTLSIPFGRVKSYKWAGNGKSRPAGRALGSNPVPVIIPCHRVIKADGTLGGFSGGLSWKKCLLNLEGVVVI